MTVPRLTEALGRGLLASRDVAVEHYPGFGATGLAARDEPASASERTALARAWGRSLGGQRTIVSIKAVGLGDLGDALLHAHHAGTRAGLVLVVFDDPEVETSQSVFDARLYRGIAPGLWLEPWDSQSALDFGSMAFVASESTGLPVVVRMTGPRRRDAEVQPIAATPSDWVSKALTEMSTYEPYHAEPLVHPVNALTHWIALNQRLANVSSLVHFIREAVGAQHEEDVTGNPGPPIRTVPIPTPDDRHSANVRVVDTYEPVIRALRDSGRFIAADLGTYTLDTARTVDACLCYGAAISVAAGYADATGKPSIALTGDAAVLHSGVVGILDSIWRRSSVCVVVIDNGSAASTGGQVTGSLDVLQAPWLIDMSPDPVKMSACLSVPGPQILRIRV